MNPEARLRSGGKITRDLCRLWKTRHDSAILVGRREEADAIWACIEELQTALPWTSQENVPDQATASDTHR